jgi:prephenate dehydrogenase
MRIAIVGTGLMGASVALAAQRRGDTVVGWDPDPDALAAAVDRGALEGSASLEDAVRDAELAVVAAPIAHLLGVAWHSPPRAGDRDRRRLDEGERVGAAAGSARFVGSHPSAADPRRRERERRCSTVQRGS